MKFARLVVLVMVLLFGVAKKVAGQDSTRGDLHAFLKRVAYTESQGNPRAVNRYGMLGKYQFHPRTLRDLGIRVSAKKFLRDEALQDTAMVRYLRANAEELRKVIERWDGKVHRGVRVTRSGILAGAHLSGSVGVLSWFYPNRFRHRTSDANGATVAMYMQKFGNYELGF